MDHSVAPVAHRVWGEGSHGSILNGNCAPNRLSSAWKPTELVYTNDLDILDRIFHDNAHLYGRGEAGDVLLWPLSQYRQILAGRASPQSQNAGREEELLLVDIATPNQALVKVRVRIGANVFLDYLTFLKTAGEWRIASKTYERLTA